MSELLAYAFVSGFDPRSLAWPLLKAVRCTDGDCNLIVAIAPSDRF
jgi:hypothetical protein